MEKKLFLSIIVPVYNAEKYVGQCLDSLLEQDVEKDEYEIICINDGSKDGSLAILQEYAKNYSNIVVVDKENGGVSKARNLGLDMAKGEYVWFIDSDDWIARNCLGYLMKQILTKNPSVVALASKKVLKEDAENYSTALLNASEIQNEIGLPFYVSTVWQVLLKTEILNKNNIRFFEHVHYGEDTTFVRDFFDSLKIEEMRGRQHLRIAHSVPAIYFYRTNESSAVGQALTTNRTKYIDSIISLARIYKGRVSTDKPAWYRKQYEELFVGQMIDCMLYWVPGSDIDIKNLLLALKKEGLFPCGANAKISLKKGKGIKGWITNIYKKLACKNLWIYKIYYNRATKNR